MSNGKESIGGRGLRIEIPGVTPDLLRSEIGFWQEMIRLRGERVSEESLERMHQALALAQCRLRQCENSASPGQKANNVYFIK